MFTDRYVGKSPKSGTDASKDTLTLTAAADSTRSPEIASAADASAGRRADRWALLIVGVRRYIHTVAN